MRKNYTIIAIIILCLVGFAFYWYEYRPSKIKQQCSADARFDQRAINEASNIKRQEFINMYYDDCLMRFGLK
jgi:hypothetical protein